MKQALEAKNARAEWIEFPAGPPLLEAMRAGAVDVGHVGETPPVFAQAGGVPFVYVATDPPAPKAEAIVVPKDSPITSVAGLKGKRVAVNRGSNVHYLLVRAVESAGLTLDDLQVSFLAPADARSAFESGKVDAWVIWDPFLAAAELAGARVLQSGEGLVDNHLFYVRSVDPHIIEMARVYDVRGLALYREVILPGALPSILVGLRFALGLSWLVLIVAETIGATQGLGYVAMNAPTSSLASS
ncbi:aliphatic sulfonate ABC transporter substrate-binding protein [Sorangium sp. So ce341]|uniref:aliphatic sulfonate ABC transporter substrate-binding protein n=1 Tax=Sorangium sp. So ce341 TaxID=3133302 RepID=UPI003F62ED09